MSLHRILRNFDRGGIEYIIIKINDDSELLNCLEFMSDGSILHSLWKPSSFNDWWYRVDPENPENKVQRHIHIAKKKHRNSKEMQASWNVDGSRHDKKSFNETIAEHNKVRSIASETLGVDKDNLQIITENNLIRSLLLGE
ncbi:DUF6367 family protein [Photobacterium leiognathi]|uniref:DUF6367 family protein n=1 Tax=Photobacterium leiognathi TaxID=553611 RepID=UPI002980F921|nr:DUF6367 family protein [Photobacterium leiognathi]